MATKKRTATKVAATVSPDPEQHEEGGAPAPQEDAPQEDAPQEDAPQEDAPADVSVIIPDEMEATTGGTTGTTGGTTGGAAPAPAAAPAAPAAAPAPAPAATTPGGGLNAGDPTGYAAWVVPAPVAAAVAPVGSSGYYTGIQVGVDPKAAPFAAWLGTDAPSASWPNP
jgi:hypothetical protein